MDVLITAAVTDSINDKNKKRNRGQNNSGRLKHSHEETIEEGLFEKGFLVVPDFVANAGG